MKKFLLMVGLALVIFFVTVFVEERELFILPLLASGPAASLGPEDETLKDVVRRYNLALVEAYRQGDPAPLNDLIGDGELREMLASDLGFLAGQGRRLTLALVDLEFVEARSAAGSIGFVTARERWRYGYTDARSRRPLEETQTVRGEVTYTLERQEGAWRIVETGLKRRLSARAG